MSAADNLARARDYLLEHGLAHGKMENQDGSVCALGAVKTAKGTCIGIVSGLETRSLASAIREIAGTSKASPFFTVAFFNDTHTESEVIDVFDRAIILAKEAEAS